MDNAPIKNELYLAVLPIVHLAANFYGLTEQIITVVPDKKWATSFFQDEVDDYKSIFQRRAEKYLSVGHSIAWEFSDEEQPDGRVVVRVTQHVG